LLVAGGGGGAGAVGQLAGHGFGGDAGHDGNPGDSDSATDGGGHAGGAGDTGGVRGDGGIASSGGTSGDPGTVGASGQGGTGGANVAAGGGGGGGAFGGGGAGGGAASVTGTFVSAAGGGGGGGSSLAPGGATGVAADGTSASVTITYTIPDTTGPTISIVSPQDGASFQLGATVDASYSCADEAGGSGLATCSGPVASGSPIDTSTAGAKSFAVTATDLAGNTATKSVHYTVSAPAAPGPPTVSIKTPAASATYTLGQLVRAAYTCKDGAGGPGIKTCTGTVAKGRPIDTSSPGPFTFKVRAISSDGQQTSKSVNYVVAPSSNANAKLIVGAAKKPGAGTSTVTLFGSIKGLSNGSVPEILQPHLYTGKCFVSGACHHTGGSFKLVADLKRASAKLLQAQTPPLKTQSRTATLIIYPVDGSNQATVTWTLHGLLLTGIDFPSKLTAHQKVTAKFEYSSLSRALCAEKCQA
jgi:hypothetical protein